MTDVHHHSHPGLIPPPRELNGAAMVVSLDQHGAAVGTVALRAGLTAGRATAVRCALNVPLVVDAVGPAPPELSIVIAAPEPRKLFSLPGHRVPQPKHK